MVGSPSRPGPKVGGAGIASDPSIAGAAVVAATAEAGAEARGREAATGVVAETRASRHCTLVKSHAFTDARAYASITVT